MSGNRKLIKNGMILSLDPKVGDLAPGDILVEDERIVEVAPSLSIEDAELIDASGMIVMPGFVDTHRHTWQTQLRGVAIDWSLFDYVTWMRTMYSVCYDPEDAYLGNYVGALEALNAGITALCDHSHLQISAAHSDALVQGLLESGIRGTFAYGVYRNPTYRPGDKIDVPALKAEMLGSLTRFHRDNAERIRNKYFPSNESRLRFGVATSEFTTFTNMAPVVEELQWCHALEPSRISSHVGVGIQGEPHIIVDLAAAGLLDERMLFVHGAHLTDEELRLVVAHGATISTTPETELQMGMGYPVIERLEAAGGRGNLGIDIASNYAGDMFAQMRLMLQTQRFRDYEALGRLPTALEYPARTILEIGTLGGAHALGLASSVGSLTPGKQADIVMIRTDSVSMAPVRDPVAAVLFYANPTDVDSVMVAGRFLKRAGRLVGVDWPRLRARLEESRDRISERLKLISPQEVRDAWASFYRTEAGSIASSHQLEAISHPM